VAAAKAVGYVGAGTVEFIVDANNPNQFYFMEMNTRLQVEHPITEMITKQDLVEWQIQVAANRRLPLKQDEIPLIGHAFEARIYAENPDNNFFPGTGRLIHLSTPNPSNHVRIDTGVRQGDEVSVFYDPMIAKLVVWDHDRKSALQRMLHALEQYQVIGMTTNITFLKRLVLHPQFVLGKVGTFFINRYRDTLLPAPKPVPGYAVGLASLGVILHELNQQYPGSTLEPNSPFAENNARRLNMNHTRDIQFLDGENKISISVQYNSNGTFNVKLPGSSQYVPAKGTLEGTEMTAFLGDELIKATVVVNDFTVHVFAHGQSFSLKIPVKDYSGATAVKGSLLSPMPGRITKVLVQVGDQVKKGAPLIIMEAMKMEHTIRSPVDGTVKKINYKINDLVGEKQLLAAIEEDTK
jgi:3-methylcrotonyl-CoA carboxylase alpha subunit